MEQPEIKTEFVAAITEHRVIGYVLSLYLIKPNEKGTFYSVTSNVLKQDMLSHPNDFTDEQKKLITLVDKYSDENLTKRFSKKKSSKEFFQEVKKEFFNEQITPFIDRQIVDSIDIIRNNNIKLFLKQAKYNNVYDADKVEILENKAVPVFHFDLTDEGLKYYLNIYQDGKPIKFRLKKHIMLTDNPCRVILDGKIYSFESMSGKKLKPFFEKEQMSIPSNLTERYLKGFVYNIVMEHDVEAIGFDILKTDAEKRVVLSLEQGLNMEPILVLKYQYGKKNVRCGEKRQC